jgi:adenylate cyclase
VGAVFMRFRTSSILIGVFLVPLALSVIGLTLLRTYQLMLPIASVILTLWAALALRGVFDAVDTAAERIRLKRSFAGQVSPAVLEEIMAGGLEPGSNARLLEVCVIFSDIRGFTTLSEAMPPETVMKVLQRYFDRMVKAVHRYDGTIDKFIGDGMMILFGAPRLVADPCSDGVQCALTMLHALDELNVEFEREGLPTLAIGIGINYGKVVVGNIGSTDRHNYSAIGDAVNVAARIEGLTKEVGRKILITESVVSCIGDRFNFEPLGERLVKGHSPVKVWGIRAERAAGATSGGAASAATTA